MAAVTFSGLDTTSLISQLVAAEKAPANVLTSQQSDLASQKSIVDNLAGAMSALGDFAQGMTLDSDVQFRTATASDSHVSVAVSGSATSTSHDVRVLQTAAAQVSGSRTFASNTAGILGTGGLQIQTGSTTASVSWGSTDTLDTIASKINDANAGVSASVLYDGTSYRLMVSATQTGTANAPTFTDSGDGLGLSSSSSVLVPAKDAQISLDGVTVTRPTNVIDDALPGVTLTLNSAQAASDPDTTVTVANDTSAITDKLNTFVSDYNTIMSQINAQLNQTVDGSTSQTAPTGSLFGDSTLTQLQTTMQGIVSQTFGSMSMLDLGLSIDKTGVMSLDTSKLDQALGTNPNALSTLFVSGGLSQQLVSLSNAYTEAGDGILTTKSQGLTDQSNSLQTEIDNINSNADALQTRLQTQFTNLEATMSQLQSQGSYISKILAG